MEFQSCRINPTATDIIVAVRFIALPESRTSGRGLTYPPEADQPQADTFLYCEIT